MTTPDRAIAEIARRQLSLITRRQALAAGMSPAMVERRRSSGRWEDVRPGVYRIGGAAPARYEALLAACLAARGLGVVSHRAAAEVHGIHLPEPAPLEVSVSRGALPRLAGVVLHRSRDLGPEQITTIDGLPVTTATRTLVDLGQVMTWWWVGRALDDLLAQRKVHLDGVRLALIGHSKRGRHGCGPLRLVLERRGLLDEDAESTLELALLHLCRAHDLPMPVAQHVVEVGGRRRRLDFAYPALRLAIEVDGYRYHAGVARFDDDRARANELVIAGWTVLRFTWQQIVYRPEWVVSVIRQAIARAAA